MAMLNKIWAVIMLIAVISGAVTNQIGDVGNALLGGGREALTLGITLGGAMCVWSGFMRVAEAGGMTALMARLLSPVMRRLFPGLDPSGPACRAMLMNMAANFLGLGNAATPFGIQAMEQLKQEHVRTGGEPGTASRYMVTFVVLNTASIQLLPTTVATLRLQYGAAVPLDILPCVWITSAASAVFAVTLSIVLHRKKSARRIPIKREVRT